MRQRHDDDDDVVRDRETIRVPLFLCDSHRPGYVPMTDEQLRERRAVRDEYLRDLTGAWKSPAQRAKNSGGASAADPKTGHADRIKWRR
jgi:hypothetical protein